MFRQFAKPRRTMARVGSSRSADSEAAVQIDSSQRGRCPDDCWPTVHGSRTTFMAYMRRHGRTAGLEPLGNPGARCQPPDPDYSLRFFELFTDPLNDLRIGSARMDAEGTVVSRTIVRRNHGCASLPGRAANALSGDFPAMVVRCNLRLYLVLSNVVARCSVQRLSHITASPSRHLWL